MGKYTFNGKTALEKGVAVYITTDAAVNGVAVVAQCTANETKAIGITAEPCDAGKGVIVNVNGDIITDVQVGANVNAGVPLKADANGKLITATADKEHVIATALKAGTTTSNIDVVLTKYDLAV